MKCIERGDIDDTVLVRSFDQGIWEKGGAWDQKKQTYTTVSLAHWSHTGFWFEETMIQISMGETNLPLSFLS